eukprot:13634080-Alexandrium_andersonii.AAC.1
MACRTWPLAASWRPAGGCRRHESEGRFGSSAWTWPRTRRPRYARGPPTANPARAHGDWSWHHMAGGPDRPGPIPPACA